MDPTRTDKQREASRANGARSLGPVTPEGKAASSRNALRHGLYARKLALSNENAEMLNAIFEDYIAEYRPKTGTETDLIAEMALAKWRQYRGWLAETAEINKQMANGSLTLQDSYESFDESIRTAVAIESSLRGSRALDLYNRVEARCNRQYHRALSTLLALRKNKKSQD
jgi:hypothetical protein